MNYVHRRFSRCMSNATHQPPQMKAKFQDSVPHQFSTTQGHQEWCRPSAEFDNTTLSGVWLPFQHLRSPKSIGSMSYLWELCPLLLKQVQTRQRLAQRQRHQSFVQPPAQTHRSSCTAQTRVTRKWSTTSKGPTPCSGPCPAPRPCWYPTSSYRTWRQTSPGWLTYSPSSMFL